MPPLPPGGLLLRVLYLSLDPYMRGRMDDAKSYAKPVEIGEPMRGESVCEVAKSDRPGYAAGDIVLAHTGWRTYATWDGPALRKLDPKAAPITTGLGVLGMPGFTAYSGLHIIGKPKPGETVVVAAASGPVGSLVGQLAKIASARAVGIAGSAEKCRYIVDELRFDAAIDHRAPDFAARLEAACPKGIDIYFESVGGAVLAAVVPLLNVGARIPLCGLIAWYNLEKLPQGVDRTPQLLTVVLRQRVKIQGFIIFDHYARMRAFQQDMSGWLRDGRVRYREDVIEGLENAPRGLIGLLQGENFGKRVVHVSDG
jgi:NADPH-dependent curcumin reductase